MKKKKKKNRSLLKSRQQKSPKRGREGSRWEGRGERRRNIKRMEFRISGNALKTFARSITCLARVGNELVLQASSSQLALDTLNASRSAFQSFTFKPNFFDVFTISGSQVQCSFLLKAVCSVLRTPIARIDHMSVHLPDPDAPKVKWTLECCNGMRKVYWITCNVEPDIQHLSLDRRKFPSSLVVKPQDLNRLLGNFQSSLQEITIIATEQTSMPSDAASQIGGKAVELRSYVDPTKESETLLHTQLWIDPSEEFIQYTHVGGPVDFTFSVKELKAFVSFCDGCEVDIHLYFDKSGEPILMAPKFGLDDGAHSSDFDSTLVLATMLGSQQNDGTSSAHTNTAAAAATHSQAADRMESQPQERCRESVSQHPSDHTRIWSELSGSAGKSDTGPEDAPQEEGQMHMNADDRHQGIQRISKIQISNDGPVTVGNHQGRYSQVNLETGDAAGSRGKSKVDERGFSQHHRSNWVDPNGDDDNDEDEDDEDEYEMCIQATPPYHEEQ